MSSLVLTRELPGVVRGKSTNPMDATTILRISRPYWKQTPTESGVYILLGEFEGELTVYVGMSTTDMRSRIAQHHVTAEKNWFGTLYAIPMNVALVQGLEAELISLFAAAGFARVANKTGEAKWVASDNLGVAAVLSTLTPWLEVLLGTEVVYGIEVEVESPAGFAGSARPAWTRERWLDWVTESGPAGTRERMEELMATWEADGRRLVFGTGTSAAGLFPMVDCESGHYWLLAVYDRTVEIVFQWLALRPVTDSIDVRQAIAERLNAIDGIEIAPHQLDRRPSFPIELLLAPDTGNQILEVDAWLADLLRSGGNGADA